MSDTNKPFKYDFDRQLNPCKKIGTKLLATAIKKQTRKDYSAAAIFLIQFSNIEIRSAFSHAKLHVMIS